MIPRGTQREPTREEREAQLVRNKQKAADLGKPSNKPVLKNEGQGLSKKQTADLTRLVEKAMSWVKANGRKYEDPDFPPSARAIYGSETPDRFPEMPQDGEVAGWKRPAEFMPEEPSLVKVDWQVENIRQGQVDDRWLISAINIVSSNTEQLWRAFLDPTKTGDGGRVKDGERSEVHTVGQQFGFYVCRFYHDDPESDDDWALVLVDDRLPLSALAPAGTARPCFASHPNPSVYWGMILEKAAAKFAGSYAQLRGGTVKQGLKLLTGGRTPPPPRLDSEEGKKLIPPSSTPFALWNDIMEKSYTNHVIGASHAVKGEDSGRVDAGKTAAAEDAEKMGLVTRRAYAIVTCGETMGFKLLKLRLPLMPEQDEEAARRMGRPAEWTGRFSDDSDDWRPQLRQMLSYSRDSKDNTFWMMYEDFCKYFNKVYFCRMADDVWTKFVVQSRWMDESAGGPPAYLSWRSNFQWLLTVTNRPINVTITLTQPDARKASGNGRGYANAIGIYVLRGNGGSDARRRKLLLDGPGDIVHEVRPKFGQEVMLQVNFDPSPRPYVILPVAHAPGIESLFKLTVQADDANDDGVPDFGFDCVHEVEDWVTSATHGAWVEGKTAAGGPPTSPEWPKNPQYQLRVEGKARVFVFLELVDVDRDGRNEAGLQDVPNYPEMGLVCAAGAGDHVKLDGPPQVLREAKPKKAEGVYVEFEVPGPTDEDNPPVVVVPYASVAGAAHKFVITVYSDVAHTLELIEPRGAGGDEAACEYCHAPAVIYKVLHKIEELEAKSERLRLLEQRFVEKGLECYNNKGVDCGPGWDEFNRQKSQLDQALMQLGGAFAPGLAGGAGGGDRLGGGGADSRRGSGRPAAGSEHEYVRVLASLEAEAKRSLRDCPDVEVDLARQRIGLRSMVSFASGRAQFADPDVDRALLDQVARAVTVVNQLLKGRGRGALHIRLDGFLSANMPCFMPCCARYQNQPESAPNCLLARARALACKNYLVDQLVAMDETGWLRSTSAAAALIFTRGYRFARDNALPEFNDGYNHPENRRVEIRVLTPEEAVAHEGRDPEPSREELTESLPEEESSNPVAGALDAMGDAMGNMFGGMFGNGGEDEPAAGADHQQQDPKAHDLPSVPGSPPPEDANETAEELRQRLVRLEPQARQTLGASVPAVELALYESAIRLVQPPAFGRNNGKFANSYAEDGKLSQVALALSTFNRLLQRDGHSGILVAVIVYPPTPDTPEGVSEARADSCAGLVAARLAEENSVPQQEVRARFVATGGDVVKPTQQDPLTGARPAVMEMRLVTVSEFDIIYDERVKADARIEARQRAEAEERANKDVRPVPPPVKAGAPASAEGGKSPGKAHSGSGAKSPARSKSPGKKKSTDAKKKSKKNKSKFCTIL
mmetsp:Transcript_24167/g.75330  ORF Transcript_24167/g.75330 Transcript_24167/m.75330 type:complete len:1388 (+) Transcript_24167:48-4211(+)